MFLQVDLLELSKFLAPTQLSTLKPSCNFTPRRTQREPLMLSRKLMETRASSDFIEDILLSWCSQSLRTTLDLELSNSLEKTFSHKSLPLALSSAVSLLVPLSPPSLWPHKKPWKPSWFTTNCLQTQNIEAFSTEFQLLSLKQVSVACTRATWPPWWSSLPTRPWDS